MERQTSEMKAIPKRVLISDLSEINGDYSSTPGGTLFSTTPGGTKIVYERSFLMDLRNSPISRTPPSWEIPDCIAPKGSPVNGYRQKKPVQIKPDVKHTNGFKDDHEQFPLEI